MGNDGCVKTDTVLASLIYTIGRRSIEQSFDDLPQRLGRVYVNTIIVGLVDFDPSENCCNHNSRWV